MRASVRSTDVRLARTGQPTAARTRVRKLRDDAFGRLGEKQRGPAGVTPSNGAKAKEGNEGFFFRDFSLPDKMPRACDVVANTQARLTITFFESEDPASAL